MFSNEKKNNNRRSSLNTEEKFQQELFVEQWNIYQNVIRNNYMYHAEIIDIVGNEMNRFDNLSILDLGCGDSYVISQCLDNIEDKHKAIDYCGIDLSLPALQLGKANLKNLNGKIGLKNNDLLSELEMHQQRHDIILLGYSLHHLKTGQKQKCFAYIAQLLSEQGVFIFYDLEMTADEDRSAYIKRACALFNQQWQDFDTTALASINTHVEENDIPENGQFYQDNFKRTGLSLINKKFVDKDNLFSVYTAKKY